MSTDNGIISLADVDVNFRVQAAGVRKAQVHALTNANLRVEEGETVGVVGESGCGKSTLAKVLVGLQRPTSGSVIYDGRDAWQMSPNQRRLFIGRHVGMIFQDPTSSLNRRMTVSQIIRDPLDIHHWKSSSDRTKRVDELLGLVGLPRSAADALPGQLSGGQRQRVAIGRALALGPRIVIADEPTSALDVSVRAQILNLLMDLKAELGIAMVYISHDIQTVRRVSDRVVTMYLGRIVEETPAADIDGRTRHPYSRALLSATPSLRHPITPIPLVGPVPSAVKPPTGCPFHTRCWRATAECSITMPPKTAERDDPNHTFSCYHPVRSDADIAQTETSALIVDSA